MSIGLCLHHTLLGTCGSLDDSRFLDDEYNHQLIDDGNAHKKTYFHISAPDFTSGLHIGFSNGFIDHEDEKWEIIAGGYYGTSFAIRNGNAGEQTLARFGFADNAKFQQVKSNLV